MTEDLVEHIEVGFEETDLPERFKLAIRLADGLIHDPVGVQADAARQKGLLAEFEPAEIVELTATITMAMGFSKIAIAWGPPPSMPVLEVPTPTPDGTVA